MSTSEPIPQEIAHLVARLPEPVQREILAVVAARVNETLAAPPGRVVETAEGDLVVDAPDWHPGRLDRHEIYAEDV